MFQDVQLRRKQKNFPTICFEYKLVNKNKIGENDKNMTFL
jgi:hypothetical protein